MKRRYLLILIAVVLVGLPFLLEASKGRHVRRFHPPPPPGQVIWFADQASGNLDQWTAGQFGEAVFNTGTGNIVISHDVAHSGTSSLKMSISDASGTTQAARILRWHDNPVEGYYSVWLYFPQNYRPAAWWNVFQFKSLSTESDPTWVLNIGNRPDGSMFFYLWDAITRTSYRPRSTLNVPPKQWIQVTAYVRRATDDSGRITIWQDGVLLFDADQVQTAFADNLHWGIGNYTDDISPSDPIIYADDAQIRDVERPQAPDRQRLK
ncbi:MAG TPA: heparin lyase I family protein [Nitrolancea sp.]|nr:heparin lyase I family protein [Nitrolancea sp.]